MQYDGHYYYGESIIDGVTNVNFSVDAIHNDAPDWPGFCGPLESPGRSGHYTKGDRQYRYIGTETLEGTTVKRYEYVQPTRPNIPRSSDGVEPVRSNHQETLWVNQTGHTVRIDLVLTATYDGAVMQRTEYEARLSGFGEPNIITTPTPEGR